MPPPGLTAGFFVMEFATNGSLEDWLSPTVYLLASKDDPGRRSPLARAACRTARSDRPCVSPRVEFPAYQRCMHEFSRSVEQQKRAQGWCPGHWSQITVLGAMDPGANPVAHRIHLQAASPSLPCLLVVLGTSRAAFPIAPGSVRSGGDILAMFESLQFRLPRLHLVDMVRILFEAFEGIHWLHTHSVNRKGQVIVHQDIKVSGPSCITPALDPIPRSSRDLFGLSVCRQPEPRVALRRRLEARVSLRPFFFLRLSEPWDA